MIKKKAAPYASINWVDLDAIKDDIKVLKNPHKGWYWHYIDNGYGRKNYRDPNIHPVDDYVLDFPGLNHLYLRIDWSDIEQEQDVYDWSYIDSIMSEWGAKGYRFAFRVCSYEASAKLPYAAPRWLRDIGCAGTDVELSISNGGGFAWEPDYEDPIYLHRLDIFTKQYAAKFDGHPLVEYVDWGSHGTWGEGHTSAGSLKMCSIDTLKKQIDIYAKHFRKTPIMLNDDIVSTRHKDSDENKWEVLNYCRTKGLGIRDDSVCVEGLAKKNAYDTMRGSWLFDFFWKHSPVDIEFEHFAGIKPEVFKGGYPFLDALQKTHASYAGFHGYPRLWLKNNYYFTEYVANRLGYWYFVEGLDIPNEVVSNTPFVFIMYWLNRGFAPAYNRFNLKMRLINKDTGYTYEQNLDDVDNRRWMPGEISEERICVDLQGLPLGIYELKVLLYEENDSRCTAIKLGVKDQYIDEAEYNFLTLIRIM